MKNIKKFILILIASTTFLASCKDDDPITPEQKAGNFTIQFDHVWGMANSPFALNTQLIHPMSKDTMTFTTVKYYISNVQLQKEDGTWWAENESYYLVDLSETDGNKLVISNVPAGAYKGIRFTHGVDSARNVSGAQEGALSILNQMFWSWNSGYIMVKMEGTSPQAEEDGTFAYHLGGFSGANNVVTQKEFAFSGAQLTVSESESHSVKFYVNPAKMWHSAGSLTTIPDKIHMPGPSATTMANDFFGFTSFNAID